MQTDKPLPPAPTHPTSALYTNPIPSPAIPTKSHTRQSPTKSSCPPPEADNGPTQPPKMPPNNTIRITICGDGGTGKSSITLRLVRSQWTSEYDPTIEDSYSINRTIDGITHHLSLTDTAGQEEYRSMWASSNLASDAFLMVYDITSPESLSALEEFDAMVEMERSDRIERVVEQQKMYKSSKTKTISEAEKAERIRNLVTMPVKIVAGNKVDLQESRKVTSKMGLDWARAHGCGFMETSARNTVNIEETFALIVRRVVDARKVAMVDAGLLPPDASALDAGIVNGMASRSGSLAAQGGLTPRMNGPPGVNGNANGSVLTPSPLKGSDEKFGFDDDDDDDGPKKVWWRRLFCMEDLRSSTFSLYILYLDDEPFDG